jgi:hypothetical protein
MGREVPYHMHHMRPDHEEGRVPSKTVDFYGY